MGRGPELDASVVIPVRNGEAVLSAQLDALARQDFPGAWEVVVAENGSTDGTGALVRSRQPGFPVDLRLVEVSRAAGINVGRNEGARRARGRGLLFCDADDLVAPSWVRGLVETLETFDLAGGPIDLGLLNSRWATQRRQLGAPHTVKGLLIPIGANFGCRAAVWELLGGFDEAFCHGAFDEWDFCYRAQVLGCTAGTAPGAMVHYRLRDDLAGFVRQQYGIGRGEMQFRIKHPGFLDPLPVRQELTQTVRASGGLVRRLRASELERDRALGLVAFHWGRLTERANSITTVVRKRPRSPAGAT